MEGIIRKNRTSRFLNRILLGLVVLLLSAGQTLAQNKQYASSEDHGKNAALVIANLISGGFNPTSTGVANVSDAGNAVDGDETTSATLEARSLSIAVLQYTGEAWLQMDFGNTVSANTTTYIKIDNPEPTGGLNIDLLQTVGGLLGLLDNNILLTEVY